MPALCTCMCDPLWAKGNEDLDTHTRVKPVRDLLVHLKHAQCLIDEAIRQRHLLVHDEYAG